MAKRSMFVGMDVHKESIDVSLAEEGRDGEVRHYGVIPGDLEAVAKVVRALRAPTRRLRFVYEAGPCGFGIHRYLTAQGEDCVVVNPSSMPKRSGDRIKTDRRDGDALARLHRAGELTAIYIPTPEDEARRLEGPTSLDRTLSDAGRPRKAKPTVATADRAGAEGLHLGHRTGGAAPRVARRRSGPSGRRHRGQAENPRGRYGHQHRWTRPSPGRGSSATNHSLGGTQPADVSSVNRR